MSGESYWSGKIQQHCQFKEIPHKEVYVSPERCFLAFGCPNDIWVPCRLKLWLASRVNESGCFGHYTHERVNDKKPRVLYIYMQYNWPRNPIEWPFLILTIVFCSHKPCIEIQYDHGLRDTAGRVGGGFYCFPAGVGQLLAAQILIVVILYPAQLVGKE